MKKTILTLVLCLFAVGPCFAQNNMQTMKSLTINAMMQYGQLLYDRGDYNGASAVFNHVLAYDSHQTQALKYLKDMGVTPIIPVVVVFRPPAIIIKVTSHPIAVQNRIAVKKAYGPMVKAVDVSDAGNLQEAIEAQKHIIEKLKVEVAQMRANLAAQSAQEPLN